ncbi:NUDIX hydrolase [Streptomyces axinellae]|uniref:NUDIX hydrolase n=1 Tax=Streptomyces axinellae TaxID=552788 RepID=A0ABN3QLX6_9ACTN
MTENTSEMVHYTADVVAVRPDGRALFIERGWDPFKGHKALPGGHVDPGEGPEQAAARELLEETGVRVAPADLTYLGRWDAPGRDPRGHYVTYAYMARVPADTTAQSGTDAVAVQWLPLETPGSLAFDHGEIVQAASRLASR